MYSNLPLKWTLISMLMLILFIGRIQAHMRMSQPAARGYPNVNAPFDYSLSSPLDPASGRIFPCGGKTAKSRIVQVRAGSSLNVVLEGSATHDGGHCQFAFSYNERDPNAWVVLKTEIRNCMRPNLNYQVPIPSDAPNGPVTFGWTWINALGNREYYMNCADIVITGGRSDGVLRGPRLFVANLPGRPTIPEMINGADDGRGYLNARPIISIRPNGPAPNPTPAPTPTPAPRPPTTYRPPPPSPPKTTRRPSFTTTPRPVMSTRSRRPPVPTAKPVPPPKPPTPVCARDGQYVCVSSMKSPEFIICRSKPLDSVRLACGPGQVCKSLAGDKIVCALAP